MDNIEYKKAVIIFDRGRHLFYGIYMGWLISLLLDFTLLEKIIYFISMIAGLLLPDIDMPNTTYGKRIKPISKWIYRKVGHRTLTHSILFVTVLYFSCNIAFGINIITTGLMIGSAIHIFCDLFTPSGVPLAYPISNKRYKLQ
jgi:inner membrane protein